MFAIKKFFMKLFLFLLNNQYKNYFLNRFVPRNLLFDLFESAEKPKWKRMAEDISEDIYT